MFMLEFTYFVLVKKGKFLQDTSVCYLKFPILYDY